MNGDKKVTLLESTVSNTIGFIYTVLLQFVLEENFQLLKSIVFTTILLLLNIARGYFVSRWFKKSKT